MLRRRDHNNKRIKRQQAFGKDTHKTSFWEGWKQGIKFLGRLEG
jgi:hypothetical protein